MLSHESINSHIETRGITPAIAASLSFGIAHQTFLQQNRQHEATIVDRVAFIECILITFSLRLIIGEVQGFRQQDSRRF
jgi:hypothetical protein